MTPLFSLARFTAPFAFATATTRLSGQADQGRLLLRLLAFLALGLPGLSSTALAHPFKASVAEADFRADTATLEIAIRFFPDDLEAALSAFAADGSTVSFARTPRAELTALLQRYVPAHFSVRPAARRAPDPAPAPAATAATPAPFAPLTWVGWELTRDAGEERVWVYVTAHLPGGIEGTRLRHAILCEAFRDQLNSIIVRAGARRATLLFRPGDGEKLLSFDGERPIISSSSPTPTHFRPVSSPIPFSSVPTRSRHDGLSVHPRCLRWSVAAVRTGSDRPRRALSRPPPRDHHRTHRSGRAPAE